METNALNPVSHADLALRPETLLALRAFARRRLQLLLARAGLILILGLSIIGLGVALLDRSWFLPEALRPWVSLLLMAGLVAALVAMLLKPLIAGRSALGLARMIETVHPSLRESLVAAIELGSGQVRGSAELCAALQQRVAAEMASLPLRSLLPASSLLLWGRRCGVALVVLGVLCAVPSLHLPGFLLRALLPFANIERPSRVKIELQRPDRPEMLAPLGSEQEVVVALKDRRGQILTESIEVKLQWRAGKAAISEASLQGRGAGLWGGTLTVGQQDVAYRILADDAISPWFEFLARPRPRIEEWVMQIKPPSYSRLPVREIKAATADLEVLEGSSIDLQPRVSEPVSEAKLQLNPDHATPLPSAVAEVQKGAVRANLEARVEVESWRLWLRSALTGWDNGESPPWKLTVLPDLPPEAQLQEPAEVVEMLPDETLRLKLSASDDVGLRRLAMAYQINAGAWVRVDLGSENPGASTEMAHVMPLGPLQLKAADTILVKAVATDLKGQEAESPAARVVILEQTITPQQRQWVELTSRLSRQAQVAAEQAQDLSKALQKWRSDDLKEGRPPERKREAEDALARSQDAMEKSNAALEDLWRQVQESARQAPGEVEAAEAQLLAQRMAQVRAEVLPELRQQLQTPQQASSDRLRRAASSMSSSLSNVAQAARWFALEDQARVGAQQSAAMARQQALLTEQSLEANRDAAKRPRWQEQQRASLSAVEPLRQRLKEVAEVADSGAQSQLREADKQIAEAAMDLGESLDGPAQSKSPEHLYGAADHLRQRLQRHSETVRKMADNASLRAAQSREQLARSGNPALAALSDAREAMRQAQQEARKPQSKPRLDREGRTSAQRAQQALASAKAQLEDQAALRDARSAISPQGGLDLNRASRAAGQLAREIANSAPAQTEAVAQRAEALEQAARTLVAEAQAADAQQAAQSALQRVDSTPQAAEAPGAKAQEASGELGTAAESLRQVAETLRKQKSQQALANTAQQAATIGKGASDQLRALAARSSVPSAPNDPQRESARQQGQRALEAAAQIKEAIAVQANEARALVAGMAPKVSEMMKQAAADLEQSRGKIEQAAAMAEKKDDAAKVAAEALALEAQSQDQQRQLQSLQAALRQEANAADWNKQSQRQLSRTADAALAQLGKTGPQVSQALQQAAQSSENPQQAAALNQAAEAQQQAAQSLQQLAGNMAKAESGQELSAEELAQAAGLEEKLEVKQSLDEAYARAQALAQMAADAKKDPAKVLAELERELPRNAAMKKSLAQIGRQLAETSEASVASEAQQPSNLGLATDQAAGDLQRVARHEERLGMKSQAQEVAKAAAALQSAAAAANAKPAMADAPPPKAPVPVGPAAVQPASQAAKAAQSAEVATAEPPLMHPLQRMTSAMLAQALDQLDAQVHPKVSSMPQAPQQGGPQQQQQGQGGQQGQQGQGAQQSLAKAEQSQRQQMNDQRNQGQAPGSQAANPSAPGDGKSPQKQGQMAASPSQGGNLEAQMVDGTLALEKILMGGDWGKLPSKMAQDLQEATRSEAAAEYRAAIENYYRAIARKAR